MLTLIRSRKAQPKLIDQSAEVRAFRLDLAQRQLSAKRERARINNTTPMVCHMVDFKKR